MQQHHFSPTLYVWWICKNFCYHQTQKNPALLVPLHFRSWERKVHRENFCSRGTFVPWNFRSLEHSLLGTFTPVELSFLGSERSKNFRFVEHSLPWNFCSLGVNVPRTFVPMKLLFHENEYSKNFRSKCPKTRPETGYKPYNSHTRINHQP